MTKVYRAEVNDPIVKKMYLLPTRRFVVGKLTSTTFGGQTCKIIGGFSDLLIHRGLSTIFTIASK